jgi:hypothetical protein
VKRFTVDAAMPLTVPSSIDSGFGPECAGKVGL